MTFLEMQTEVFARLNESSASPVFWSLVNVKAAINEGYESIADASEFLEESNTLTLVGGTVDYDMPSEFSTTILSIKHIWNVQTSRWLDFVTERDLDNEVVEWETVEGEPQKVTFRGAEYMSVFPHVASTAGTMTVYHTSIPAVLSADGDTPAFPEELHYGLVEYAVFDLMAQERSYAKSARYYKEYQKYERRLIEYVEGRTSMDRIPVLSV